MEPAELEATGVDTVEVKFRDEVFTFPATMDDAPLSTLRSFDDKEYSYVVEGLIGKEQWERLLAIPGIKIRDVGPLFDEYLKVSGQNPGELPAS